MTPGIEKFIHTIALGAKRHAKRVIQAFSGLSATFALNARTYGIHPAGWGLAPLPVNDAAPSGPSLVETRQVGLPSLASAAS